MARNTGRRACYAYTPARKVSIFKIALQSTKRTRQHESCGYQHYQSPGGARAPRATTFQCATIPHEGCFGSQTGRQPVRVAVLLYLIFTLPLAHSTTLGPRRGTIVPPSRGSHPAHNVLAPGRGTRVPPPPGRSVAVFSARGLVTLDHCFLW